MKKNTMMRIASVLLVAVLLSTCTISGTFAKYVTEGESMDQARVARWGVYVTANGSTFAKVYETHDPKYVSARANSVITNEAFSNMNVVAPGTSGDMVRMTLVGQPEVAVEVTYEAEVKLGENWKDAKGNYYCPLVIEVAGTKYWLDSYTDAGEAERVIEAAIKEYTKSYDANTDLAKVGNDALAISWSWPFSTSDDNDIKDTYLGNQCAAGHAATISITVTTTVTQID